MISRRPASISIDMTHFPKDGRKSKDPVMPVIPAPKPLFDTQENDEKNASTIGKPWATSTILGEDDFVHPHRVHHFLVVVFHIADFLIIYKIQAAKTCLQFFIRIFVK